MEVIFCYNIDGEMENNIKNIIEDFLMKIEKIPLNLERIIFITN